MFRFLGRQSCVVSPYPVPRRKGGGGPEAAPPPSFQKGCSPEGGEHPYNAKTVAAFVGWPNRKVKDVLQTLEAEEEARVCISRR